MAAEVRAASALALGAFKKGESMVGEVAAMADEASVRAIIQSPNDDPEYRLLGQRLRQSRSLELRARAVNPRRPRARAG